MTHETHHAGYLISDNPVLLDVDAIHAFLTRSVWGECISRDIVARSVANSLCIGIYAPGGSQIGLVRAISDYATFAYLCDVYVLEAHRRRGLSKAVMQLVATHPKLQGLRRQHLVTPDAHGLYARFGFAAVAHPERHMEKCDFDVYKRTAAKQG